MAIIGSKLGVSAVSLSLLVFPFLMMMIQSSHAYAVAKGLRRLLFAYDPAACPMDGPVAIAVPVLLHSTLDEIALATRMQENFARQSCPCVVVLLTDFEDSAVGQPSADECKRLASLVSAMQDAFKESPLGWLILHRDRSFSHTQSAYIGWERKRGKVLQFCQLLHFGIDAFSEKHNSDRVSLTGMKWVLVADEDSMLLNNALDANGCSSAST